MISMVVLTMFLQTPVPRPSPPKVIERAWIQIPLDAFFLHRLESAGQKPRPEAPPAELLDRITRDLIGRAATADEIAAYTSSRDKRIYEKTVDRLLEDAGFSSRFRRTRALVEKKAASPDWQRAIAAACWTELLGQPLDLPPALDWLACEFVDPTLVNCCELDRIPQSNDLKHLVKTIVVSAAYRQRRSD